MTRELDDWKKVARRHIPYKIRKILRTTFVIIVLIVAGYIATIKFSQMRNEVVISEIEANDKTQKQSAKPASSPNISPPVPQIGCYQEDWHEFTSEKWEHLNWFTKVNGVYSLPHESTVRDITAEHKTPCKGGVIYSVRFIPITTELIDINLYFGNWFRWEIGGNDRRSVRLYKNTLGCAAMKDVVEINTKKKFLDNHRMISMEQPVTASMSAYLTETGRARTELFLTYVDEKSGQEFAENGFEYEFEVNPSCGEYYTPNKILNIDENEERFKIGLMKSSWYPEILPSVKLIGYKISKRDSNSK